MKNKQVLHGQPHMPVRTFSKQNLSIAKKKEELTSAGQKDIFHQKKQETSARGHTEGETRDDNYKSYGGRCSSSSL